VSKCASWLDRLGSCKLFSTNTFEIEYSQTHAQAFLDQAQMNTISGFVPNALGADPNWGKCLQCAVVDRARLKLQPVPARSDVCTKCFSQYCYDPSNPPSSSEIVGRKQTFKDPDLASKAKAGLKRVVAALIGVAVGLLLLVSALISYLYVSLFLPFPMPGN
jgi:lysophospholipase